MFILPYIDPVAIKISFVKIHWYSIAYILGFIFFFILAKYRIKKNYIKITKEQLDNLLTYGVLGVIIGGRLGYVLFYNPSEYLAHPINIIKVWQGGMSFHGGFLGVLIATFIFAYRNKINYRELLDFIAPFTPIGLGLGRLGNFINGELFGRITALDKFWAMGFPTAKSEDLYAVLSNPNLKAIYNQYGMLPRHPSQLYEFLLEGVVLFLILFLYSRKKRPIGQIAALFLICYGLFRFIIEFTRQPDAQLGLLSLGMSMGQWLSLPMFLIGIIWFISTITKPNRNYTI